MFSARIATLCLPVLLLSLPLQTAASADAAQDAPSADVAADTVLAPPPDDSVLIPGGTFLMGAEDEARGDSPPHEVSVEAFRLDRHEVTNGEYAVFCEAAGRKFPEFWGMEEFRSGLEYPDHPVVGVSWYDARAYAEWCGKRLPTEAEWEYAARGGLPGRPYPFGEEITPEHANYAKSDTGGPVPVGSYEPNGFGLHDMCGNVLEWVSDWYDRDYYLQSPAADPAGPEKGRFHVIRGGGWHTGPGCARVYVRNALVPGWVDFNLGFRCARDAE